MASLRAWLTLPGGILTNLALFFFGSLGAGLGAARFATGDGGPFWLIAGLAAIATPIVAARRARGRMVAITTRRLLVVQGGRVIESVSLREVQAVEARDDVGDAGELLVTLTSNQKREDLTLRGIEEGQHLAEAAEVVRQGGDVQAFLAAPPVFRRELDERSSGSPSAAGCLAIILTGLALFVLSELLAGRVAQALGAFVVLWIFFLIALRRWLGHTAGAVHFLEVSPRGVTVCTYAMDAAKARLNRRERTIPFDRIAEIILDDPNGSGSAQKLVVDGESVSMPHYLLFSAPSVARWVRTIQHYRPDVPLRGYVALLNRDGDVES